MRSVQTERCLCIESNVETPVGEAGPNCPACHGRGVVLDDEPAWLSDGVPLVEVVAPQELSERFCAAMLAFGGAR